MATEPPKEWPTRETSSALSAERLRQDAPIIEGLSFRGRPWRSLAVSEQVYGSDMEIVLQIVRQPAPWRAPDTLECTRMTTGPMSPLRDNRPRMANCRPPERLVAPASRAVALDPALALARVAMVIVVSSLTSLSYVGHSGFRGARDAFGGYASQRGLGPRPGVRLGAPPGPRADVLVHPEAVVGVVAALDLGQATIVRAIGALDPSDSSSGMKLT